MEEVNHLHPEEPDPASLLSGLYTEQKRLEDAEKVLRRALQGKPRNVVLLNNLSNTLTRLERLDGAEEILKRIIEVEPKVFDHRVRMAAFYSYRKDLANAEATLREAVRLDPENEQRRLVFAEFMSTRKDPKAGEAILLEAMNDLSRSTKVRFALGQLYETTDQKPKARSLYQEIVSEELTRPAALEAQVKLAALDLAEGKEKRLRSGSKRCLRRNRPPRTH